MNRKKICTAVLTIALCASMTLTAHAVYDPMKAMEEASRQAVAAAVKAGTVPQGTTIYDCAYSTDEKGVTIVVRYKDKNGNWIDIITQKKTIDMPAGASSSANKPIEKLSDEALAEYVDEVFRMVNEERESAGLDPLERDSLLDEAAMIRASEVHIVDAARGEPHTRPDGTNFRTVLNDMGIDGDRCAENLNRVKSTPQAAMESWMKSDGHREIILRERYGSIGIGVYQRADGKLDWIQIFERK